MLRFAQLKQKLVMRIDVEFEPDILAPVYAGVAELVDAPVSKTGEGDLMPVRFRPSANLVSLTLRCFLIR